MLRYLISSIKAWVASAADALKGWNPFDMFTVDMDGAAGKAGAALGGFVDKIDDIFGSGIKDTIRKAWGFESIPIEEYEQQLKDSTDAISGADKASKDLSESVRKTTDETRAMGVAVKKNTDGLIALTTETGEVKYVTEDMARAMLNGEAAMTDAANASGTAAGVISGNAANVNTSMTTIKAKTGEVNETVQTTTEKAVEQAQESTETSGGNLGEWLYNGFISKIEAWFPGATNKIQNAINSAVSGVQIPEIPGIENAVPNIVNGTKELWKGLGGKTGLTTEDLDADIKKDPDDDGNKKPTTTGKKKGSSGTKKTVAQQIEEKYKPKLEANKAAREALDSEYELWQAENQYCVVYQQPEEGKGHRRKGRWFGDRQGHQRWCEGRCAHCGRCRERHDRECHGHCKGCARDHQQGDGRRLRVHAPDRARGGPDQRAGRCGRDRQCLCSDKIAEP